MSAFRLLDAEIDWIDKRSLTVSAAPAYKPPAHQRSMSSSCGLIKVPSSRVRNFDVKEGTAVPFACHTVYFSILTETNGVVAYLPFALLPIYGGLLTSSQIALSISLLAA